MQLPYRKPGKFTLQKQDPVLSAGKIQELEAQLESLKKNSRPRAASEVKRLAELGDFSENVEYQLAKGKLRGINQRILEIDYQLKHAVTVVHTKDVDTVQVGHTVTVESGGKEKVFQILGSTETDPMRGIISYQSPIGAALVGRKVGDQVVVPLKNGVETVYTIISIG